jgi:hypothetical protein
MIDAIDGSFIANPPKRNNALFGDFDERLLNVPTKYGIIGYQIIGNHHQVWFKNFTHLWDFITIHHHR